MAVSLDVLNATQSELYDPDIRGFVQDLYLYPELEKRGKVNTERGPSIQWPIPYGASAEAIGIDNGDETAPTDRATRTNQYEIAPHRLFAVITIPGLDVDTNDGKRGALKLYDMYPKAFLEGFPLALERYIHTGISGNTDLVKTAALQGFGTLNGLFSSGTKTGTTNGFLDFAAKGAQTDTVLDVAKSEAQYHYNQYQESNNAAELLAKLSLGIRQANHFGKKKKGVQLLELDPDSFAKYIEVRRDYLRLQVVNGKMDDGVDNEGGMLLGAKVVENQHIVLTDFTGDAAEGVGYGLNFDFLKWSWWRKPQMSKFREKAIANQDVFVADFLCMFAWYFEKLTAQVAFAGTART
jgi:hypothetical protein